MEQQTDDWRMARCGKITASSVYKVLMKSDTATYKNYLAEIVAERVSNTPTESYTNAAMQWGVDTEELARLAYELLNGLNVEQVGFVQHDSLPIGASPDGLVGDKGLIEIKCPNTATHLETLLNDEINDQYIAQMQCQMWITDRDWCDFVSYDPRLIGNAQLKIIRVERNLVAIEYMKSKCHDFLLKVDKTVERINRINGV